MRSDHKWRCMLVYIGLLPMLMCMGCGKQPDIPELPAGQNGDTMRRGAEERRSTGVLPESTFPELQDARSAAAPGVAVLVSASDTPPIPFRLAALIEQLDGNVRAGLVSRDEEQDAVVGIGERFMGYELVAADASKGEVVLQLEGKRYVLSLECSASQSALRGPAVEAGRRPSQSFESTPEERKLGIGPNDPSTWEPGYRGPDIEHAVDSKPQYEPTADELQRGINPNEPSTWPEDYRGPGIERAAAQLEGVTQDFNHE